MGGVHLKTALRLVLPLILGQLNKLNSKGENQDCHAFMVLNLNQFYIHGWWHILKTCNLGCFQKV